MLPWEFVELGSESYRCLGCGGFVVGSLVGVTGGFMCGTCYDGRTEKIVDNMALLLWRAARVRCPHGANSCCEWLGRPDEVEEHMLRCELMTLRARTAALQVEVLQQAQVIARQEEELNEARRLIRVQEVPEVSNEDTRRRSRSKSQRDRQAWRTDMSVLNAQFSRLASSSSRVK